MQRLLTAIVLLVRLVVFKRAMLALSVVAALVPVALAYSLPYAAHHALRELLLLLVLVLPVLVAVGLAAGPMFAPYSPTTTSSRLSGTQGILAKTLALVIASLLPAAIAALSSAATLEARGIEYAWHFEAVEFGDSVEGRFGRRADDVTSIALSWRDGEQDWATLPVDLSEFEWEKSVPITVDFALIASRFPPPVNPLVSDPMEVTVVDAATAEAVGRSPKFEGRRARVYAQGGQVYSLRLAAGAGRYIPVIGPDGIQVGTHQQSHWATMLKALGLAACASLCVAALGVCCALFFHAGSVLLIVAAFVGTGVVLSTTGGPTATASQLIRHVGGADGSADDQSENPVVKWLAPPDFLAREAREAVLSGRAWRLKGDPPPHQHALIWATCFLALSLLLVRYRDDGRDWSASEAEL